MGDTGADAALDDGAPVYGYPGLTGCYAQYLTCPAEKLAPIPAGLPVTDAAAAPIDALTAEQGLTDELGIGAGDQVLITAGAGGVGHFAVQIARILGAEVVATASPQHHEFLHRLGAAVVIDHTKPDWPDQVRDVTDGGARARAGLCGAHPGGRGPGGPRRGAHRHPGARRGFRTGSGSAGSRYNGQASGTRLIRMAPWFDDGSLTVTVQARYFWHNAAGGARGREARAHPGQARPGRRRPTSPRRDGGLTAARVRPGFRNRRAPGRPGRRCGAPPP